MSVVAAVRMLDGTDALVIRSCVNVRDCSTPDNPDVITFVKRSREPVDLANLQAQLQKNSRERIILRPEGADEQCGVQVKFRESLVNSESL